MYYLYDMTNMSMIDKSNDKYDFIDTMSTYFKAYTNPFFMIKYHDKEKQEDSIVKIIHNIGDYYDYCKEYEDIKLKEMSCCDLKKLILRK